MLARLMMRLWILRSTICIVLRFGKQQQQHGLQKPHFTFKLVLRLNCHQLWFHVRNNCGTWAAFFCIYLCIDVRIDFWQMVDSMLSPLGCHLAPSGRKWPSESTKWHQDDFHSQRRCRLFLKQFPRPPPSGPRGKFHWFDTELGTIVANCCNTVRT